MLTGDRGGFGEDWAPIQVVEGVGQAWTLQGDKPSADRKGRWAPENRGQPEQSNRVEGSSEDQVPN